MSKNFKNLLIILCAISFSLMIFGAEIPQKRVVISWEKSKESDLNFYKIYRKVGLEDFNLIGTTKSVQFLDTNIDEKTTYTYTVSAIDTSSNESTKSLEVSFVNSDLTAPATIRVTGASAQNDVYVGISVTK